MDNDNKIEVMKQKLKSATKLELSKKRDLCQIRNRERSVNEELSAVKAEIELLKEELEDVKSQIAQTRHQILLIKICSTSEKYKFDAHIANLENHGKGFQELFDKEHDVFNRRMKEIHDKEAEEEELQRQREKEITEKREQEAREAAAVEAESEALEQECVILKKRNNAIMLQLRRKLMETENTRRKLAIDLDATS